MSAFALPETRYVHTGDGVHVAYQVLGDGPIDVVVAPGVLSHVEHFWEFPGYEQFLRGAATWARVITFDKRGNGMSDPVDHVATLDERIDDIRAVMDAVGSRRCALMGISESGALCAFFAATYPERVSHLVIYGGFSRLASEDLELTALQEAFLKDAAANWGTGVMAPVLFASRADDARVRSLCARMERLSSSPGAFLRQMQMNVLIDVRDVLPLVRVPTLVCRPQHDFLPPEEYDALAGDIPDARLVELTGFDHYFALDDVTPLLRLLREFVTGETSEASPPDRVLQTVLFTDIVDSTGTAVELGDTRWRQLLDRHDLAVRRALERYRGVEVNTTGDGFLAVFDGPGRAVLCARAVVDAARAIGVETRAGVHTGECEVRGDDYAGIAVHIGARVCALAQPGEVLATSTVRDLVAGSAITFTDRGCHTLKGVPGEWTILAAQA